jgi:hypothetical protein
VECGLWKRRTTRGWERGMARGRINRRGDGDGWRLPGWGFFREGACLPACPCGTRRPLVDGGHVCVIERLVSLPDPRLVRVGWLWLTRGAGGHAPTGTGWPGTLALAWLGWPWAGRANRSARARLPARFGLLGLLRAGWREGACPRSRLRFAVW